MRQQQRQRRSGRSIRPRRELKQRIVILCEGKSEEAYLRVLMRTRYGGSLHSRYEITIAQGNGTSLFNLVQTAAHQKYREADFIWIVCDVDRNVAHSQRLTKWLREDVERHHCVISHPCLESWLLAHFDPQSAPHNADEAYARLLVHIPGYAKGQCPSLDLLEKTDGAILAMKNRATRLQEHTTLDPIWPDSGLSYLYRLIEFLDSL